jgi:hypothetical protein
VSTEDPNAPEQLEERVAPAAGISISVKVKGTFVF